MSVMVSIMVRSARAHLAGINLLTGGGPCSSYPHFTLEEAVIFCRVVACPATCRAAAAGVQPGSCDGDGC